MIRMDYTKNRDELKSNSIADGHLCESVYTGQRYIGFNQVCPAGEPLPLLIFNMGHYYALFKGAVPRFDEYVNKELLIMCLLITAFILLDVFLVNRK